MALRERARTGSPSRHPLRTPVQAVSEQDTQRALARCSHKAAMSSRRSDGFRGSPSRHPPEPQPPEALDVEDISLEEDEAGGGVITEVITGFFLPYCSECPRCRAAPPGQLMARGSDRQ